MQPNDGELSKLNNQYLDSVWRSNSRTAQIYFNNCLEFRVLLYYLRQRLSSFIVDKFNRFIGEHRLNDRSRSYIRREIRDKVRTDFSSRGLKQQEIKSRTEKANHRKLLIERFDTNQIKADWRTFARCYTGNFVSSNAYQNFNVEKDFDPKDLLEVVMNCSLFSYNLYDPALQVIKDRNRYYGHLAELLIDPIDINTLKCSTSLLEARIPIIPIGY